MKAVLEIIALAERSGQKLETGFALKVENHGYMPLSIEHIGNVGPYGRATISVAHYYEQNGDLMRDPEMLFELIEQGGKRSLFPFGFRQDSTAFERESTWVEGGQVFVNERARKEDASFSRLWNRNLVAQGFVSAYRKQLSKNSGAQI